MYDEQYVHIDGEEKYRALLKDSKTGSFVESILDDLSEETLIDFFVRSIPRFNVDKEIYVTTDGFHYASILRKTASILGSKGRDAYSTLKKIWHTGSRILTRRTNLTWQRD